ncbi:hypothetical protein SKAU_G00424460 [Synaphobranchus kaupii]|uniref:Integrase catalytic domain-containing protein n=1 Tax=Synaphobranchus kaupii TaxID=118154 RepID=A0A9Q1IAN0_SYNKA|nr:hypothetical protein SKAU_G00424460 [Synaphobranchus kaupii]
MGSHKLTSYLAGKGIRHIRTAFYNPAANGRVERLNQSLKNGIRAHLAQGCTLTTSLLQTLLQYRATRHATTGVSPASLMLGRELQLPLDRLRPTPAPAPAHLVQAAVAARQRWTKDRFDRARRVKPPAIAVSDWCGPWRREHDQTRTQEIRLSVHTGSKHSAQRAVSV